MTTETKRLLIIGGGAAGLTSAIFASRMGLDTILFERLMPGGQVINAEKIEDYPGVPESISGAELVGNMQMQAMSYGTDIVLEEVISLSKPSDLVNLETTEKTYMANAVIIAGGSTLRRLNVPGEDKFVGHGVSYCATCDGAFFLDQDICVVGGGDSALEEAITLTEFASSVTILCKNQDLHGQQILQDRVSANDKINICYNVNVEEIKGDREVNTLLIKDELSGNTSEKKTGGVFIFVGLDPNTTYLGDFLNTDTGGHIETDSLMKTEIPGILAAGDIRSNSASQLVSAAGDGATAATSAYHFIQSGKW